MRSLAPPAIPTVMSSEAWDDFGVPVAPYFILVDGPTGSVVGEGAATSWPHVRELLQRRHGRQPVGRPPHVRRCG